MPQRSRSCPTWLDDEARREWRRLHATGAVGGKDPETVAAYCFTLSLWTRMRDLVDHLQGQAAAGWTTQDGQQRPHPALAIEARLAADLLELSASLDLEPLGREAPKPSRVLFLDEGR